MKYAIAGSAAALLALAPAAARADFLVRSPYEIDYHELEIEHNGDAVFDRRPAQKNAQSYTIEFGTGLTTWWHTELELGFDRPPGDGQVTMLTQAVWENMVQLTEPGKYFADFGFYFEYGQSLTHGANAGPNQITFGPIIAKEIGRTVTTVNLFLTRQLGPDQTTQGLDFNFAMQTRWNIWEPLSPAVEIYGDMGVLGATGKFNQQQWLAGPVAVGLLRLNDLGLGPAGKIKYEIGWLFGMTSASPRNALRWRLELEIPF